MAQTMAVACKVYSQNLWLFGQSIIACTLCVCVNEQSSLVLCDSEVLDKPLLC